PAYARFPSPVTEKTLRGPAPGSSCARQVAAFPSWQAGCTAKEPRGDGSDGDRRPGDVAAPGARMGHASRAACVLGLHVCLAGLPRRGGVQEVGRPDTALYVEMWQEAAQLEAHIRSRGYQQLLALMDTAAACPELRFNFVAETRGLAWFEQLRLGKAV